MAGVRRRGDPRRSRRLGGGVEALPPRPPIGRLWIGPPWEEPPADAVTVVIDPGRPSAPAATRRRVFRSACCSTSRRRASSTSAAAPACSPSRPLVSGSIPSSRSTWRMRRSPRPARTQRRTASLWTFPGRHVAGDALPATDVAVANITVGDAHALAGRVESASADHRSGTLCPSRSTSRAGSGQPPRGQRVGGGPFHARVGKHRASIGRTWPRFRWIFWAARCRIRMRRRSASGLFATGMWRPGLLHGRGGAQHLLRDARGRSQVAPGGTPGCAAGAQGVRDRMRRESRRRFRGAAGQRHGRRAPERTHRCLRRRRCRVDRLRPREAASTASARSSRCRTAAASRAASA